MESNQSDNIASNAEMNCTRQLRKKPQTDYVQNNSFKQSAQYDVNAYQSTNLPTFQTTSSGASKHSTLNWRSKSNNSRASNQLPPAPPFPLQYQNYHQNTGNNNISANTNRYNFGNYTNINSNKQHNKNKFYEHKKNMNNNRHNYNECSNTNESLTVNIDSYALINTLSPSQQHSASFYRNKTFNFPNDTDNNKSNLGCSDGASADNSSSVVSTPTPDAISPKTNSTHNSNEDNSLRSSASSCFSSSHQTASHSSLSSHGQLTSPLLTNTNKVEHLENTKILTVDTQTELKVDLTQKELINYQNQQSIDTLSNTNSIKCQNDTYSPISKSVNFEKSDSLVYNQKRNGIFNKFTNKNHLLNRHLHQQRRHFNSLSMPSDPQGQSSAASTATNQVSPYVVNSPNPIYLQMPPASPYGSNQSFLHANNNNYYNQNYQHSLAAQIYSPGSARLNPTLSQPKVHQNYNQIPPANTNSCYVPSNIQPYSLIDPQSMYSITNSLGSLSITTQIPQQHSQQIYNQFSASGTGSTQQKPSHSDSYNSYASPLPNQLNIASHLPIQHQQPLPSPYYNMMPYNVPPAIQPIIVNPTLNPASSINSNLKNSSNYAGPSYPIQSTSYFNLVPYVPTNHSVPNSNIDNKNLINTQNDNSGIGSASNIQKQSQNSNKAPSSNQSQTNFQINDAQPTEVYGYYHLIPQQVTGFNGQQKQQLQHQQNSAMPSNMCMMINQQQQQYQQGLIPIQTNYQYNQSQTQQMYQQQGQSYFQGQTNQIAPVHTINSPQTKNNNEMPYLKKKACYNCGSMDHAASDCREPTIETSMSQTNQFHLNFKPNSPLANNQNSNTSNSNGYVNHHVGDSSRQSTDLVK